MGCPGEHHLGTRRLLVLLDGNEVGKGLQGVHGGSFHGEYGFAGVLHKLVVDGLCIVIVAVGKTSKGTDADDVAITAHHRDSLQQMLALVAIHDDTALGLQFPCTSIDIKHDDIHAEVLCRLLCGEACTQTIVEEHEQGCLVLAKFCKFITVLLYLLCLGKCLLQVAKVFCIEKTFHMISV